MVILLPALFLASRFTEDDKAKLIILYGGFLLCGLVYIVLLFTRVRIEPVLLDVNKLGKIDFENADKGDDSSSEINEPIYPGAVEGTVNENQNQGVIRPLWSAFFVFYLILSFAVLIGYFYEHVSIFNILPQILLRGSLTAAAFLHARGLIFLNPNIQRFSLWLLIIGLVLVGHDFSIMVSIFKKEDFLLSFLSLFSLPGLFTLMKVIPKPTATMTKNSRVIETLKRLVVDKSTVVDLYQQLYSATFLAFVKRGSENTVEAMIFLIYSTHDNSRELPVFTSDEYANHFIGIYPNNDSALVVMPGALIWPQLLEVIFEKEEVVAIDPCQTHGIRLNYNMILGMVSKYGGKKGEGPERGHART